MTSIRTARGEFTISGDKSRLDVAAIHGYLTASYWASGIDRDTVARAIEGSVCIGLYDAQGAQAGFARLVTDVATFAYLADVYVLEVHRGLGLGKALVAEVLGQPFVAGLRRVLLATRDAHGLYLQNGFQPIKSPQSLMEIHRPDIYSPVGHAAS